MPRNITPQMLTALRSPRVTIVPFVYGEFTSGPLYAWGGHGTVTWDGHDWLGMGALGKVEFPEEDTEIHANQFKIELSGLDSDLLRMAVSECKQGKPCRVWLGVLGDDGLIVPDPLLCAAGWIDVPEVQKGVETSTISITVESAYIEMQMPRERRYTSEDQALEYPDDRGFDFVPSLQNWNKQW